MAWYKDLGRESSDKGGSSLPRKIVCFLNTCVQSQHNRTWEVARGGFRSPNPVSKGRAIRMNQIKTVEGWMAERKISLEELLLRTTIDREIVSAIVLGRYTPSPTQRRALAAALEVSADQVTWGHVNPVEHVYGHGPQFGRSP